MLDNRKQSIASNSFLLYLLQLQQLVAVVELHFGAR